jgi:inner membrane protein
LDGITQAALGACVTAACVPREHRRKALLAGAMLGILPDLDLFIDYGDVVRNFTYHRGFSHSLLVLPGAAVIIWFALRRWWAPVRAAPRHWLAGIFLALVTHPLLDAHTAYGTQLLWPFEPVPVKWATMFIIDPAYTLPLLIGAIAASIWPSRQAASTVLLVGLFLSVAYLGWTWLGKTLVEREARNALAETGTPYTAIFSTPTPLNSLLWRVVVRTEDGYLEGFDSVLVDEGTMTFTSHPSDVEALQDASHVWAVQRLRWFAGDFVRADVIDGRLVISDLRMGHEPHYVFRHVVAEYANPHWIAITPERARMEFDRADLSEIWWRINNH